MSNLAEAEQNRSKSFPDNLPPGWREKLASQKTESYFKELSAFIRSELKSGKKIYPAQEHMLRALQLVDLPDVRVVILGQDPYHGPGQAVGLCFAVPNELRLKPPSLQNIFKELQSDIGFQWNKKDSELVGWARQGVLLLNTLLSVREGSPLSHSEKGWEIFTDGIIKTLNQRKDPIIFLLWGSNAQKKIELISSAHHFILKAPHPSPLSANRGFFGCKHFSKANEILRDLGKDPIRWDEIR